MADRQNVELTSEELAEVATSLVTATVACAVARCIMGGEGLYDINGKPIKKNAARDHANRLTLLYESKLKNLVDSKKCKMKDMNKNGLENNSHITGYDSKICPVLTPDSEIKSNGNDIYTSGERTQYSTKSNGNGIYSSEKRTQYGARSNGNDIYTREKRTQYGAKSNGNGIHSSKERTHYSTEETFLSRKKDRKFSEICSIL